MEKDRKEIQFNSICSNQHRGSPRDSRKSLTGMEGYEGPGLEPESGCPGQSHHAEGPGTGFVEKGLLEVVLKALPLKLPVRKDSEFFSFLF